jgi:hypothetical protein
MDSLQRERRAFPGAVLFGISGVFGSCASGVLLYPLDTVRTRLQLQCGTNSKHYKGVFSTFHLMFKEESLRAFYRGLPVHVAALSSWSFVYFGIYNGLKHSLPMSHEHPFQQALSAGTAWIAAVSLTNPLWIIKTRAQVQRDPFTMAKAAAQMVELWRGGRMMVGVQAAMGGAVMVMIQLPLYEHLKRTLLEMKWLLSSDDPPYLSAAGFLTCSTLSMTVSSVLTYPQDVVRARLQGTNKYSGLVDCLQRTIREESFRGLYSGLSAHLTRLLPTSAITFIVYEWTCAWLSDVDWLYG